MRQLRVQRNGAIRLPVDMMDALEIYPERKIEVRREGDSIVIRKAAAEEDPFAKAAEGPDLSQMDKIRQQQKEAAEKAKDRFDELMADPPEIKPEDNPDLWR